MNSPPDRIALTIAEACRAIGVGRTTFWRMTKAGLINPFELHGVKLVRRADLEALVDAAYQAQAARRNGTTLDAAGG
jgi:hypothetical protein